MTAQVLDSKILGHRHLIKPAMEKQIVAFEHRRDSEQQPPPRGPETGGLDHMKIVKFEKSRVAYYIPLWDLETETQVKVWHTYIKGYPEPFMQNFGYPIESIKFIRDDFNLRSIYRNLFKNIHKFYESLFEMNVKIHVMRPTAIIAGRCAIAQVFPLNDHMQNEFKDLLYQRVLIKETFLRKNSRLIKCYCVDTGATIHVDIRHLFFMLDEFAKTPQQIIEISLRKLNKWKMRTELRNLFLRGLHLQNSQITLKILKESDGDGGFAVVRMESSRFPGRDLLEVIRTNMKKLLKEPTRAKYRSMEKKAMKEYSGLIPFTSLVPVAIEGINFGTVDGPVVYPEVGNVLDLVIIGFSNTQAGVLHVMPYLSTRTKPLGCFENDINYYYRREWMKSLHQCHCMKDGFHFVVRTKHGYERCRILRREYGAAFNFTPKNKTVHRTVRVLLLDKGDIVTVKCCDLRYIPPEFAVRAPAQAIVANWCRTDNAGQAVMFEWSDREWEAFGRFAVNNQLRFFGRVISVNRETYGRIIINVEFRNPAQDPRSGNRSSFVLDPKSRFWLKKEPPKVYRNPFVLGPIRPSNAGGRPY